MKTEFENCVIGKERDAWVVWSNTDRNEGKSLWFPVYVCETPSTAKRLSLGVGVMGAPGVITKEKVFHLDGVLYGPIDLQNSTKEDDEAEKIRKLSENGKAAIQRAIELGLSEQDVNVLLSLANK